MRYGLGEKKLVELLKGEYLKELLSEPLDDDSDEIEVDREVEDDRDDAGVDFSTDAYDDELEAAEELREESDEGIVSILSKGTLEVVVLNALYTRGPQVLYLVPAICPLHRCL